MHNLILVVSSALAFISYIVYIIAILKGKAKPHRTTRFVLLVITGLATISLFAQGSTSSVWLSGVFTIGCLIVFLLSVKRGMGGWEKIDIICLLTAFFGIAVWKLTENPFYALAASIMADFTGQIPMLIKTYKYPETEVWTFYFLDVLAAVLNLTAINGLLLYELAYPLYIILIDGVVILLILRPAFISWKKSKPREKTS